MFPCQSSLYDSATPLVAEILILEPVVPAKSELERLRQEIQDWLLELGFL